jgi:hypothetical protein
MTKKYTITLNEKQLRAICEATDLQQRIQLGQWLEIRDNLPLDYKNIDWSEFHNDMDEIGRLLSKHMIDGINGTNSSLGVGNEKLPESNSILYEIHRCIRHKLSWEKAVEDGIVESEDSPRKFPQMMTVNYDEPMKYSDEPFIQIERIEE